MTQLRDIFLSFWNIFNNTFKQILIDMPILEIVDGYWQRVGLLRDAKLLNAELKTMLTNTLSHKFKDFF